MDTVEREPSWDVLCHHAADVTNYRSPDFDVSAAVAGNTHNLPAVLKALGTKGCRRVVLTGSVFEPQEGQGELDYGELRAFSPYGVSKGMTADIFRYDVSRHGMLLGKFVIPNPFGPYEEPRFTAYLLKTWMSGQMAEVRTPAYVRDNIHVSLLAAAYRRFVEQLPAEPGFQKLNPSGYVESQGAFAERFAREMRRRLNLECLLVLRQQTEFPEPRTRVNTDPLDAADLGWNEWQAWDDIAAYYREMQRVE
jgi:nucleoside-diphosphate-sugar epimerase